jgi:hypothetical protein
MTKKKDLSLREINDDANRQASMDYIPPKDLVLTVDPILNYKLVNEWRKKHGRNVLNH